MSNFVSSSLIGFDELVDSEEVLLIVLGGLDGVLQEILVPNRVHRLRVLQPLLVHLLGVD
jgi:hypothetical protein